MRLRLTLKHGRHIGSEGLIERGICCWESMFLDLFQDQGRSDVIHAAQLVNCVVHEIWTSISRDLGHASHPILFSLFAGAHMSYATTPILSGQVDLPHYFITSCVRRNFPRSCQDLHVDQATVAGWRVICADPI